MTWTENQIRTQRVALKGSAAAATSTSYFPSVPSEVFATSNRSHSEPVPATVWVSDSSTNRLPVMDPAGELEELRVLGAEAHFEDGYDSILGRHVRESMATFGSPLAILSSQWMISRRLAPEVSAEILRTLGQLRHPSSHDARHWVLAKMLRSPDAMLRDASILGLVALRDPRAIPELRDAKPQEPIAELRADYDEAIRALTEPFGNAPSEDK